MDTGKHYVVMVTDGTVMEYAPEVYLLRARAWQEAERWAWILAGGGWAEVASPFPGRWDVGDRSVRLVEVEAAPSLDELWVLTYWDEDGVPDPVALLRAGTAAARTWVAAGDGNRFAREVVELPWMIAATYDRGGEEAYAVAHRAKVVLGF